jgi:nitrate/nitrite transport system substrate-binding protein
LLSKEILPQHPCCVFGCTRQFVRQNPNTFLALYRAVLDSIHYCAQSENRLSVAAAIHTEPYLDQPLAVVEQVMTGDYHDGLGNVRHDPDRFHFAPLPTQAMANWILDQMKRWGYLKADASYAEVARQVFLSTGVEATLRELAAEIGAAANPVS